MFGLQKEYYNDFVSVFKKYPNIEKVLIFGSRAKKTNKPSSDFDLAVFAPTMSSTEFSKLWNELDELPIIFKLDILHWDKLSNKRLKEKIKKEGQLFYENKSYEDKKAHP